MMYYFHQFKVAQANFRLSKIIFIRRNGFNLPNEISSHKYNQSRLLQNNLKRDYHNKGNVEQVYEIQLLNIATFIKISQNEYIPSTDVTTKLPKTLIKLLLYQFWKFT